ncbi:hypothetical protein OUZ56_028601 [Daphnia magna]|uniref:Uncharacterized protein n=1 Tax=Daphnia magna TaxID=35525 RepID=A0ABR0B4C1_9CRUS|nr:hypothetical protein OUZ56_028601 [Daphnia magna]
MICAGTLVADLSNYCARCLIASFAGRQCNLFISLGSSRGPVLNGEKMADGRKVNEAGRCVSTLYEEMERQMEASTRNFADYLHSPSVVQYLDAVSLN